MQKPAQRIQHKQDSLLHTHKYDVTTAAQPENGGEQTDADAAMQKNEQIDNEKPQQTTSRTQWLSALQQVLPVYVAVHLAFFVITCLALLFPLGDFSNRSVSVRALWQSWNRWDTLHYTYLATHGYTNWWRTAFFPLYPVCERLVAFVVRSPLFAGYLISDVAGLAMLVVLYRLVSEDFDEQRAYRTILYLSFFPTAFFFAAAYNESLFLLVTLLGFYAMRHGNWWLAGFFGLLGSLTRIAGLLLFIPFCYEYLRQHEIVWLQSRRLQLSLHNLHLDALAGLLIPGGLGLFSVYCYFTFHTPFPFLDAEKANWNRVLHTPLYGIVTASAQILQSPSFLSFSALRNALDLGQLAFISVLIALAFVGPWRFPPRFWAYSLFALTLYITLQLHPVEGFAPLQSVPRYMLEVFPAFIVLAALGKERWLHQIYLAVSASIMIFLLIQFLTDHWIT